MRHFNSFESKGLVLGKLWGGGVATYPAERLYDEGMGRHGLINRAILMLKSGALDSGMGFESLKGAILYITETSYVTVKGKTYHREETSIEFIGELTEEEKERLEIMDCDY